MVWALLLRYRGSAGGAAVFLENSVYLVVIALLVLTPIYLTGWYHSLWWLLLYIPSSVILTILLTKD